MAGKTDDRAVARLIRVATYLVIGLAVTGCERNSTVSSPGNRPAPDELIVLIGPSASHARSAGIAGGARRFAREYPPLRVQIVTPSDNSAAALGQATREAVALKPGAICLFVEDVAAVRPVINELSQANVILVTMGADSRDAAAYAHIGIDTEGAAELLGARLEDVAAGKKSYLLVHGSSVGERQRRLYERFMLKARSRYGVTLLEEQDAGSETNVAELLREMFGRFKHAGLVVTLDPAVWLKQPASELLGDNARFATLSATPALWECLRSGEAAALVGPLDGEIGFQAVETALLGITKSKEGTGRRTVECELVTPATLDDFARRYAEAAGLNVDELLKPRATSQPAPTSRPAVTP